jgi:soluble lytic murein transglycosylase-like protein
MRYQRVLTWPVLAMSVLLFPAVGDAFCFNAAGEKYKIDPLLLKSIATQESGLNPGAINHNKNHAGKIISTDYGVMQINSSHIPALISMGIIHSKDDLLNNACLNVQTGAWILARHIKQCGVNWMCLGSYNAGFRENNDEKRMKYARRIYIIYGGYLAEAKKAS